MATVEYVILSSSPHTQCTRRISRLPVVGPPPSPGSLPFDSNTPKSTRAMSTKQSRAAKIPDGAPVGFRSATTIAKEIGLDLSYTRDAHKTGPADRSASDIVFENDEGTPEAKPKPAKRKRSTKQDSDKTPTPHKPSKSTKKKPTDKSASAEPNADGDIPGGKKTKAVNTGGQRQRKDKSDTQTRLRKGKVVKPGAAVPAEILDVQKSGTSIAPGPDKLISSVELPTLDQLPQHHPSDDGNVLGLPPALKRRDVWTPPRETEEVSRRPGSVFSADGRTDGLSDPSPYASGQAAFANLQGQFGYNGQTVRSNVPSKSTHVVGDSLAKRRRIEVVDVSLPAPPNQDAMPKKAKPPQKSARTITGIAVAKFNSPEKAAPVSLTANHPFFVPAALPKPNASEMDNGASALPPSGQKKTKSRRKAGDDAPRTKKTTKLTNPPIPVAPKLLSPATALKKIARQEVFFGTSSQIASGESPSFIQDLRKAIADSGNVTGGPSSHLGTTGLVSQMQHVAHRGLWSEGARNEDSFFVPSQRHSKSLGNKSTVEEPIDRWSSDSFLDIDTLEVNPHVQGSVQTEEVEATSLQPTSGTMMRPVSAQGPPLSQLSSSTSMPKLTVDLNGFQKPALPSSAPGREVLQPLDTNPKADPIKTSNPTLLQSHGVDKLARGSIVAEDRNNDADPEKTKQKITERRPRGRPRKDRSVSQKAAALPTKKHENSLKTIRPSVATPAKPSPGDWRSIDEIEDSDPEPKSSPPRRRSPRPAAPLQLSLPPSAQPQAPPTEQTTSDPAADQALLFHQITKTVKSVSRSTDPKHPSWYEKMLMYDPIVLEDFTAWLNSGVLKTLGGRHEKVKIEAQVVQRWCDEKSVCCLWREGLWGGVKKRY